MDARFDPNNVIIRLCMSGMGLEDSGKEWAILTNRERQEWRDNLNKNKGEIIN